MRTRLCGSLATQATYSTPGTAPRASSTSAAATRIRSVARSTRRATSRSPARATTKWSVVLHRLGRQAEARADVEDRHDGPAQVDHAFDDGRRPRQRRQRRGPLQFAHVGRGQAVLLAADLKYDDFQELPFHGLVPFPPTRSEMT